MSPFIPAMAGIVLLSIAGACYATARQHEQRGDMTFNPVGIAGTIVGVFGIVLLIVAALLVD